MSTVRLVLNFNEILNDISVKLLSEIKRRFTVINLFLNKLELYQEKQMSSLKQNKFLLSKIKQV